MPMNFIRAGQGWCQVTLLRMDVKITRKAEAKVVAAPGKADIGGLWSKIPVFLCGNGVSVSVWWL